MTTKIRLICLIICLLGYKEAFSQNLTFFSTSHDFGEIAEDGGDVKCTFKFKNSGTFPVVIIAAESSCGCTVPEYSRQPIRVGEESSIVVTFDPMNRAGNFSKNIEIITAPDSKRYVLTITGTATPRKKSIEELYPYKMGDGFRIAVNYYPLSYIAQGERVEGQISYINESKRSAKISLRPIHSSGVLNVESEFTVDPHAKGKLTIAYDLSEVKEHYGVLKDRYYVDVNGKESKYNIIINGHAIDNFNEDQRSSPPICNLSHHIIKLGEIKKGRISTKARLTIENSGIRELIIRDVDLGEDVKSTLSQGATIAAGASQSFEVWAESKNIDYGNFSRYITITVNDPDAPVQRVRVTGIVED